MKITKCSEKPFVLEKNRALKQFSQQETGCISPGILKDILKNTYYTKLNYSTNKSGAPNWVDVQIVFEFNRIASYEEMLLAFDNAIKYAKLWIFS